MDFELELFRRLTEASGVSGAEGEVRRVLEEALTPGAQTRTDRLGSLVACLPGPAGGPKVMLAAHLDEIGMMVARITEEGFLGIQTIGGWWEPVLVGQRVVVKTRRGSLPGVIGAKPPHLLTEEQRKKPINRSDLYVDIGVADRQEAEAAGVRPGDPVAVLCTFEPMANPDFLLAKAWDNRAGCAAVALAARHLAEVERPNTVFAVATVQEEVGLRGAVTAANMVEPDVAFAVDVVVAGDVPGMKPEEAQARLGRGPAVFVYDASLLPPRGLLDLVTRTAEEEGIPLQYDVMPRGATDAGRIQLTGPGVPSLALGVPARYIHSPAGIIHRRDLEQLVRLLVAVVRRLDRETVEDLGNR